MSTAADLPVITDFRELILEQKPLIDLRAPAEFLKGSLPNAVGLPLLNDEERKAVGTCYKHNGQKAAIALGHKLVSGTTKSERVEAWVAFVRQHPSAGLYCWRGGLRSEVVQQWLAEQGCVVPRVQGGFKAVRNFLLTQIDHLADNSRLVLIGGRTGVGKTDLLAELPNTVDLEGLAHHRGSAFGNRSRPQPPQIDFENDLAAAWIARSGGEPGTFVMEDEGKFIGRCRLPPRLIAAFGRADLLILECEFSERVARINRDYVSGLLAELQTEGHDDPFSIFRQSLLGSLARIKKRLGLERYGEVAALMSTALDIHENQGTTDAHDDWIAQLLTQYYDPMYDYQIKKRTNRVIGSGVASSILQRLSENERRVRTQPA